MISSAITNYLLVNLKTILLSLIGLALVSLGAAAYARYRFEHHKNTAIAIQKKKIKVKQLQEMIDGLSKSGCQPEIVKILGKMMLDLLGEIKDIYPSYPGIDVVIAATQQLNALTPNRRVGNRQAADTDHEVATRQKLTLATIAQIKKCPALGRCTYAEAKNWEEHLKMLYVQIEIDAHIAFAEEAQARQDKAEAANHLRIAQNKLAQSKYHGEEKKDIMIKLGDRIRDLYKKPNTSIADE